MMPTIPPDSHKISLKIIEAIQQHPVLYISEVKGNAVKLQEFRQKVWKRIADELSLDSGWVKLKWKNLRDTYCRILKYKNKSSAKGSRRKKWIFEDHLSFLKFPYEADYEPQMVELSDEYIEDINSGSVTSQGLLDQLEDKEDEDYSEYLEVLEDPSMDPLVQSQLLLENDTISQSLIEVDTSSEVNNFDEQNAIDIYAQQIESKYRKIRPKKQKMDSSNEIESNNTFTFATPTLTLDNITETNSGGQIFVTKPLSGKTQKMTVKEKNKNGLENKDFINDSVDLFFDSMAQTVKRLPPKAQADVKMDICKIVTEAEVRYSRQNTPQQQYISQPGTIPKLVLIPCHVIDDQNNKS